MKKNLFRVMACVLAFALMLSLAACGGKANNSSTAPNSSAASSEAASSTPVSASEPESKAESSTAAPADGKYASIQEFLEDPQVSSQLETMMSALGDDMDIDVSADGDRLVYTFKFSEEIEDLEATKSAMEEQMNDDTFASTFKNIAGSLSEAIEVENPSVVVTYLAMDGTEIYSQEYFAE